MIFSFRESEFEYIEIDVLGYERTVGEYWDDNWLKIDMRVQSGGFHGKAAASIMTAELTAFLPELQQLFKTLSGSANFATLERQLGLRLVGDNKGHIELSGVVADESSLGNELHFTLQFDQTQLKTSIHELEQVTSQFPVRNT